MHTPGRAAVAPWRGWGWRSGRAPVAGPAADQPVEHSLLPREGQQRRRTGRRGGGGAARHGRREGEGERVGAPV
jgi:hypothetical protein